MIRVRIGTRQDIRTFRTWFRLLSSAGVLTLLVGSVRVVGGLMLPMGKNMGKNAVWVKVWVFSGHKKGRLLLSGLSC